MFLPICVSLSVFQCLVLGAIDLLVICDCEFPLTLT